tara:strand:+ start:4141 stop:5208 length:1068 start_codon:yes stop_codon:yes gene_type:complete
MSATSNELVIDVTIDGEPFPFVTQLNIDAKVNSARSATCLCTSVDALEKIRIGAEVIIKYGKGDLITNKEFVGIIRVINPSIGNFSFVAYDYITELANSEIINFKQGDFQGMDLYMAIAEVANYKNTSISKMTQGSGIILDDTMNFSGYATRKDFIDNCINFMVDITTDDDHPLHSYLPYYYAIKAGKNFEVFQPDHLHNNVRADLTISLDDSNIISDGLLANYTSVGMINSCTVVSSSNRDLSFTYNDEGSIAKYGVMSKKVEYLTSRIDVLEKVGRLVVEQFKNPTKGYRITINNGEWLPLGSIVELRTPALKKVEFLPVVGYKIMINEELSTIIEVGNNALTSDVLITSFRQ